MRYERALQTHDILRPPHLLVYRPIVVLSTEASGLN